MKHTRLITLFAIGGLIKVLTRNTATLVRGRKFWPVIALGLVISSICLGWSVLPPSAPQLERGLFLAYGPADFVRSAGKPAPDLRNFSLLNTQTEYRLQIFNGGLDSQFSRVASAVVTLNGRQVASLSDFNSNMGLLERPLDPAATNSLSVELRSAPKSGLTLQVIGVDNELPTITAAAEPPASATGWNNSDVTVSFTCADSISGIESCTPPVVLTSEGTGHVVTGTATDRAQNSRQASLTINVDKRAPGITLISPTAGAVVSDQTLTVTGTISEELSGVESVTCGGAAASVSGSNFTCHQTLDEGENTIAIEALDRAGNRSSTTVNVTRKSAMVEEEEAEIQKAQLTPDVIFVGGSEEVTVSARIPYDGILGAPQVTLQRIDTAGNVLGVEGSLHDDGDEEKGDLVRGDGVFSLRRLYTAQVAEQLRFRVSYQRDGRELRSRVLQLGFYNRLTEAQINNILSTQESAAQRYVDLSLSLGEEQARNAVLAEIRQNPGVITAGISASESTISVLYAPGIIGSIYLHQPGTRGGGGATAHAPHAVAPLGNFASAMPRSMPLDGDDDSDDQENMIQSRRALILSPFHAEFAPADESLELKQLLEDRECPDYEVTYLADQAASVDSFKNLDRYGIIAIISHGTTLWQGLLPPGGGFHGLPLGVEVYSLITSEQVPAEGISQREHDLVSGRLAIVTFSSGKTYFSILPTFIPHYSPEDFPNSLVYLGTCQSAANDTMSRAFIGQGAKTYLGFTKVVSSAFAREVGLEFFQKFIGDPMKKTGGADGAFIPGQYDSFPCLFSDGSIRQICQDPEKAELVRRSRGAKFEMFGSEELERPNGLLNGGFEAGDLDGWGFHRDTTVVSQLGDIQPVSGDYMGMVSKINGWFGMVIQDFCLPTEATRIEFDWNLITEQGCGGRFDNPDVFWVRLTGPDLYHQVLSTGVREQCSKLKPTTIDLPSDSYYGNARATGWQHASIDISDVASQMNGQKIDLRFEILQDVNHGDGITDSVVLIDNVRIVK